MALSTIELFIENDDLSGCVNINSTAKTSDYGNISYIHIFRFDDNRPLSQKIFEIKINTVDDLNFILKDMSTVPGKKYTYFIELADSNQTGYNVIEFDEIYGIECYLDGIFIGNDDAQYVARLDTNISTTRNTNVNYVNTLLSRTPYRVSNGNLNYTTGSVSGLFISVDDDSKLVIEQYNEYKEKVISFLCDGTSKILKTSNGSIWYVSIDSNVNAEFNNYYTGYNIINFNWTEIGDVPVFKSIDSSEGVNE